MKKQSIIILTGLFLLFLFIKLFNSSYTVKFNPEIRQQTILADIKKLSLQNNNDPYSSFILWNFFASWCAPCIQEMPLLSSLKDKKLIDLVGVVFHDDPRNIKVFLNRYHNPFDKVVNYGDLFMQDEIGLSKVPFTMLTNRDGKIIFSKLGGLNKKDISDIIKIITTNNNKIIPFMDLKSN